MSFFIGFSQQECATGLGVDIRDLSNVNVVAFRLRNETRAPILSIIRAVCDAFNVPQVDLCHARRVGAEPRQVAYWLCRKLTSATAKDVARVFGRKHFTTVAFGVRKIDRLIKQQHETGRTALRLKAMLEQSA